LPKTKRAYKSAKRNRELDRQKKQEKKRLRRLGIEPQAEDGVETTPPAEPAPDAATPGDPETPDPTDLA
jgi:hypothetical protein